MLEAVIVFLGIVVVWLLDKLSPQVRAPSVRMHSVLVMIVTEML